jgi:uncharacterized protein with GYD domain
MASFLMLGKYTNESLEGISAARTRKAEQLVTESGGEIKAAYALLGFYDIALIVDLPGAEEAARVSLAFYKLTGINFTTSPAVALERFDELAESV